MAEPETIKYAYEQHVHHDTTDGFGRMIRIVGGLLPVGCQVPALMVGDVMIDVRSKELHVWMAKTQN